MAEWVQPLAQEVAAEFDPLEIRLFGSVARGDDDGDSDIDLLVILESYDPADAITLKQRASRRVDLPVPFDVSFTDTDRIVRRSRIAGTLERAATIDGRSIFRRG